MDELINQEFVNSLLARDAVGAGDRLRHLHDVERSEENVLAAAVAVEEAVTTGTDIQQEVAELVAVVRDYHRVRDGKS